MNKNQKHIRIIVGIISFLVLGIIAYIAIETTNFGENKLYPNASKKRIQDETLAATLIKDAREKLANGDFNEARKVVLEVRDSCHHAISGRTSAILLLDSIELMQAQIDTSSTDREMKILFYKKKLEHDRKELSQNIQ